MSMDTLAFFNADLSLDKEPSKRRKKKFNINYTYCKMKIVVRRNIRGSKSAEINGVIKINS